MEFKVDDKLRKHALKLFPIKAPKEKLRIVRKLKPELITMQIAKACYGGCLCSLHESCESCSSDSSYNRLKDLILKLPAIRKQYEKLRQKKR